MLRGAIKARLGCYQHPVGPPRIETPPTLTDPCDTHRPAVDNPPTVHRRPDVCTCRPPLSSIGSSTYSALASTIVGSNSDYQQAETRVAAYHQTCLRELTEHIADAIDQYRTGACVSSSDLAPLIVVNLGPISRSDWACWWTMTT